MDLSLEETSSLLNINNPKPSRTMICLEQNICLPSNLLQKKKNILQQYRILKTSQNSRVATAREPITLMSKTFCHSKDMNRVDQMKLDILIEQKLEKKKYKSKDKLVKNPLYRRLSNIQADSKELAGVSFSKLLSRMLIIDDKQKQPKKQFSDYQKKKHQTIESKSKNIPNYHCLESKLFTIQCPENKHESFKSTPKRSLNLSPVRTAEPTNRLFRRYFNPHGQKTDMMSEYESLQFDQRYIYRNGKKAECKRIHNFYTSQMFKKNYQKHMRNTIDTFYSVDRSSRQ